MGIHKIKPLEIYDLTNSGEGVSVVMKVTKNVTTSETVADIKKKVKDSPWHEDDMAKAHMAKNTEASKLKDPVARLRKVNELLGR